MRKRIISLLTAGIMLSSSAAVTPVRAAEDDTPVSGNYSSGVSGDVNADGVFGVADVVLMQKWLLTAPGAELIDWEAGDLCKNGRLDVFDLCMMKRTLFGKTSAEYVKPDSFLEFGPRFTTDEELKLYLGPDESYDAADTVPADTSLNEWGFQEANDLWIFTQYNGQYGWIRAYKEDDVTPTVHFEMMAKKPVIYLYPEEETDVHIELELTESELSTTYPRYNNGWDVTAYPDGTLLNRADGTHHRYLFWDSVNCRTRFDFSKGFCIAGDDTESFLREKLTCMGLNEDEMNEFIVYWLPLMEHNAYNLISFQSDAYTDTAKLDITPSPDSVCRIFMAYVPLDENVDAEPQELETFERNGFTVVEWGGCEVKQ
jgi:endoglucanase